MVNRINTNRYLLRALPQAERLEITNFVWILAPAPPHPLSFLIPPSNEHAPVVTKVRGVYKTLERQFSKQSAFAST
jgi:hypothetical protein